ncbi:AI-2E family transporter [bacterium]|nr:AI-2E family transporter [bacterium]
MSSSESRQNSDRKRIARLEKELRGQTICLAIGIGVLALWGLYWLSPVLIPFVLALFIVSGLTPVLSGIQSRFSTSRLVSVLIASLLGFALVFVLWSIIWVSVAQLGQGGERYVRGAQAWWDRVPDVLKHPDASFQKLLTWDGSSKNAQGDAGSSDLESKAEGTDAANAGASGEQPGTAAPNDQSDSGPLDDSTLKLIKELANLGVKWLTGSVSYMIQTGTMVVIFVFFLLLGGSQVSIPAETWREIDQKIREYILTKSLISFFTGLAFGFVLWIFGVPLAAVFALLAFLFNFIPNIGPIIACILPLPLILFDPDMAPWKMTLVIVLSSTVQVVSGNVIEPRMMGDSFDVHPIAILLALMFWSLIWGLIGMFLAVPMTAVMKILFAKFEMTKPLADLLAGRIDGLSFKNFNFSASMDSEETSSEDQGEPGSPAQNEAYGGPESPEQHGSSDER